MGETGTGIAEGRGIGDHDSRSGSLGGGVGSAANDQKLLIGHTVAGGGTRMAQAEAAGLECDKLSKSAIEAQFSAMVEKLAAEVGSLAGKTLVSTHVDSWESGSGNWTAGFRDEFRRRRGYDLLPYLPTLNGLVVDSLEASERFFRDWRETICEMLLDNYAGHLRELAHKKGLRLSIEAYDGTCDDLRFAGRADEPMCEFWQRGCPRTPSAARTAYSNRGRNGFVPREHAIIVTRARRCSSRRSLAGCSLPTNA
jgi:hypothetical protein